MNYIKTWIRTKITFLDSSERWHDLGHIMAAFIFTTIVGHWNPIYGIAFTLAYALIKEFALDGYVGYDTWKDLSEYIIGMAIALPFLYF